jgi:hypothetical protein
MYPLIPGNCYADPKGSANHTLGTIAMTCTGNTFVSVPRLGVLLVPELTVTTSQRAE